ncbi:MAG: GreA/GreB family elongation factor, partial [Clostridia bacterium]|nr:GreA/GreB family elongation factor [Clostridia bacterium]
MEWILTLLGFLMITIILYLIFPVIYKIKTGGVAEKKAHILSLVNVIVVLIIITIIKVIFLNNEPASVPTAFTYYWIARAIMSKKEKPNQLDEKEETTSQVETNLSEKKEITEETLEKVEKVDEIVPPKCFPNEKIEEVTKEVITIGSIVTIYDEEFGEETYKIVSAKSEKEENEIHIFTPLAQALVGHTVGEVVTVKAENEYKIKILKVGGTKMQIPENHRRTDRKI